MRRLIYYFSTPLLIILICIFASCDNYQEQMDSLTPTDPLIEIDPPVKNYTFYDYGCPDQVLGKTLQTGNYLYEWEVNNDLLNLDFRFINTCGSIYMDSVLFMQDTISICLTDTARSHARCICEHQCQFEFLVEGMDHIPLLMEIKFYAQDVYTACVDTLLQW